VHTLITREPGDRPAPRSCGTSSVRHGQAARSDAETLLFAAARDDHVRTVIHSRARPGHLGAVRPLLGFDAGLSGQARPRSRPALLNAMQRVTSRPQAPTSPSSLDVPVEVGLKARRSPPRRRRA